MSSSVPLPLYSIGYTWVEWLAAIVHVSSLSYALCLVSRSCGGRLGESWISLLTCTVDRRQWKIALLAFFIGYHNNFDFAAVLQLLLRWVSFLFRTLTKWTRLCLNFRSRVPNEVSSTTRNTRCWKNFQTVYCPLLEFQFFNRFWQKWDCRVVGIRSDSGPPNLRL